ncbi:hypothetical protein CDAR_491401 [Caerostris darwini]|uniref:Uncharacterized protein n=1 Tax=Caerostris darwini TaxID=1538125 RepID=A0AAV4X8Y4_9ARAC|nr:hypothetical protein CDAR_491401 [Caerostris darwini]
MNWRISGDGLLPLNYSCHHKKEAITHSASTSKGIPLMHCNNGRMMNDIKDIMPSLAGRIGTKKRKKKSSNRRKTGTEQKANDNTKRKRFWEPETPKTQTTLLWLGELRSKLKKVSWWPKILRAPLLPPLSESFRRINVQRKGGRMNQGVVESSR